MIIYVHIYISIYRGQCIGQYFQGAYARRNPQPACRYLESAGLHCTKQSDVGGDNGGKPYNQSGQTNGF